MLKVVEPGINVDQNEDFHPKVAHGFSVLCLTNIGKRLYQMGLINVFLTTWDSLYEKVFAGVDWTG